MARWGHRWGGGAGAGRGAVAVEFSEEASSDSVAPSGTELASAASGLAVTFLPVWYLCIAGDWLQGPYVYALYESYGLPRADIARLFVAGFGASLAFGTVAGSWVDSIGPKRGCQLYCVLYVISCATKHFNGFWFLLAGRLTGGVATSLLFCAFEAWLIREREGELTRRRVGASQVSQQRGEDLVLRRTFGLMWFGSSLVAIAAGLLGDAAVGLMPLTKVSRVFNVGGLTAPFDFAAMLLLVGLALLTATWEENLGDEGKASGDGQLRAEQSRESPTELLGRAAAVVSGDGTLLALMAVVACFEGSTYAFIFNWTSAVTDGAVVAPALGKVFATFMLAYTSGSLAFQLRPAAPSDQPAAAAKTEQDTGLTTPSAAAAAAAVAVSAVEPLRVALALAVPALLAAAASLSFLPAGSVERTVGVLGGFIVFEFCCGLYAPSVSATKGALVPEQLRSSIYSTYRAPMNAVVLVVLLSDAPPAGCLFACACLLAAAVLAGLALPSSRAQVAYGAEKS